MRRLHFLAAIFGLALLPLSVIAHPPDANGEHKHSKPDAKAAKPVELLPKGMVLPAMEGPAPWTDKPVLNDPRRFHIAIMTDNTGGHRPGVWMKAVRRLNLMRPEFVVSVGDLIEGYSRDRAKVEAEWREFLGFMKEMEMKFFFVAGNHDVSNPLMHEIWREHFGAEWYSFDYKDVHFVCLSSEDPETRIGDKQLEWITADLEKNKDARWTLVFLHKPLWVDAERAIAEKTTDRTNWKKVEALLGTRPHTVFSGHVHHYVQYDRNGMKYYHLGTTGGSSQMRGLSYGEFDHVTWLTMEADGPRVANLMLEGILPADVVTEKGVARFREFLAKTQLEVAPILIDDDGGLEQGRIDLRLANRFDAKVEFAGRIAGLPLSGLTVEPAELKVAASSGEMKQWAVNVRFGQKIDFLHLTQTVLTGTIRTVGVDPPLVADVSVPVIIDRKFPLPKVAGVAVDGNLGEWQNLPLTAGEKPLVIGNNATWQGVTDASMQFTVARDDVMLYVAARVTDDAVISPGDGIEIRLDGRAINARKRDPRLREGTYHVRIDVPKDDGAVEPAVSTFERRAVPKGTTAAVKRGDGGYAIEAALPLEMITKHQGAGWQSIQCTLVVNDVDEAGQAPSRVVWRGTRDVGQRNTNFGQFVRVAP
jgi:hypothetical protein